MKPTILIYILLLSVNLLFGKEYDLQTVLKMAEENNKEIQIANSNLKTASAEKLDAFSRALPKIDVNAGYNRNFQENVFFFEATNPQTGKLETNSFKTSFANEFSLNAVLSQTLFSFEVGYAIQAAKYFNKFTNFNFEATRQQVLTQVKTAFYQAMLLKEVLDVARESEASSKENYENIKIKFESGIVSEFELLQTETRWQNDIPETIRAHQEYELALNNLKMLMGLAINEPMELVGSIQTFPELPEIPAFETVTEERPDYNSLLWEKKLREKNVSVQKAKYFPSLEGNFRYTYSASSDEFRLDQENDNFILGLSLQIPLFSGGSTIAQVRKASAEVDRVRTRIKEADAAIQIELQNIHLRMREALQRIQATRNAAQTARRAFEIAETRVDNGLSTQVELKDSRVALDQAQVNYYSAIFDYLSAYFDWELATGNVSFSGGS